MLKIKNLTKVYPNGVKAIDNLNLEIGKGMFGLLGPNGAGKSTLMRTIATLQRADVGVISFKDIDVFDQPMQIRKLLGYLPQDFGVFPKVSAMSLLKYYATLKGIASSKEKQRIIDQVLELTNLYDVRHKAVSSYSGGMKQRFGIAQMLLNRPQLIIVDEPTAGLDPSERNRFLNILREIGADNTVIFSTHIVEDVKDLCTEMAIINHGKVLNHVNPISATQNIKGKIWIKTIDRSELKKESVQYQLLSSSFNYDNSINIRVHATERPDEKFKMTEPSLEDVYFLTLADSAKAL